MRIGLRWAWRMSSSATPWRRALARMIGSTHPSYLVRCGMTTHEAVHRPHRRHQRRVRLVRRDPRVHRRRGRHHRRLPAPHRVGLDLGDTPVMSDRPDITDADRLDILRRGIEIDEAQIDQLVDAAAALYTNAGQFLP